MSKKSLIRELRDRGVVRVAGLYIAVCWLFLQIFDVLFPAFDIPDSTLRYILLAAAGGFPLVCLLAWFYEITPEGIFSDGELRERGIDRGGNHALLATTAVVLALGLGISLYVNFKLATDEPVEAPDTLSILIADFQNYTGDSLFDGSLESALAIGMEGAPFITAYGRHDALRLAKKTHAGNTLNVESARLIAVREDIDLVMAGSITESNGGYTLTQRALEPMDGKLVAEAEATASSKADVLAAVGSLAGLIRTSLGDISLEDGTLAKNETLTATSLQAVRYFTQGQAHAFREENEEAITYFEKAVAEDPELGRAYTAWALSEFKLGHREKSVALWKKALSLIGNNSQRESYRTLGIYYSVVSNDQTKAIETYERLVEMYPADSIGWNNLAVSYFYTLQFDKAQDVGARLVELFPNNPAFRTNYALFAMYAGEFTVALEQAELVLGEEPDYFLAYIPLAMAHIVQSDLLAAEQTYTAMGSKGKRALSVAVTGQADIAMLQGDYAKAALLLEQGRSRDLENGNTQGAAYKGIHLARAMAAAGDTPGALELLRENLKDNAAISQLVPAALLYIELGEVDIARQIQQQLESNLQQSHRAAATFVEGAIALGARDYVAAVDAFNASLQQSDSWLTHFYLGRTYAAAAYHAQALGEFELCMERIGESTALYLDDIPTFEYHVPLYYWRGRTRQALGMQAEGAEDIEHYLSLRVDSDDSAWTQAARRASSEDGGGS